MDREKGTGSEKAPAAPASPSPQEGSCDFRGTRLHYLLWEPAAPASPDPSASRRAPLVLVHAFAQSARSWAQVAPALAQGRAVYAIDLVGQGESARPDSTEAYDLLAQGEALRAFSAHVAGIEAASQPSQLPLIAGAAMGGRVAISALCGDPASFARCASGLVLEGVWLGPVDEAERDRAARADVDLAARLRRNGLEALADEWERGDAGAAADGGADADALGTLPPSPRAALREELLANDAEALALSLELAGRHAMPGRAQVVDALGEACARGVPVLHLAGERDGECRVQAEQLRAASAAPAAAAPAVRIVEGVGRFVHLQRPEAFVAAIEDCSAARSAAPCDPSRGPVPPVQKGVEP